MENEWKMGHVLITLLAILVGAATAALHRLLVAFVIIYAGTKLRQSEALLCCCTQAPRSTLSRSSG